MQPSMELDNAKEDENSSPPQPQVTFSQSSSRPPPPIAAQAPTWHRASGRAMAEDGGEGTALSAKVRTSTALTLPSNKPVIHSCYFRVLLSC